MVSIRQGIIPKGNKNRPGSKLANVPLYVTVHETGNPAANATAEMHREFTEGGGGASSVSFHFVVDEHEAIQLLPLDEIGWHAGDGCDNYPDGIGTDDIGCFGSIAIEVCVNKGANFNQTLLNLEILIAMIVSGYKRFDYGDGRAKNLLSISRIAQHNAWSGKNCPQTIRETNRWGEVVSGAIREYNMLSPLPVVDDPVFKPVVPIPVFDGTDKKVGNIIWHALSRKVTLSHDTTPRGWASDKALPASNRVKAGRVFDSLYIVQNGDKQWWYVTKEGWRILMGKCVQKFRPSER